MIIGIYNLPTLAFIGGETKEYTFSLKINAKTPYEDADQCKVNFSVISYVNRDYEEPVISLSSDTDPEQIHAERDANGTFSKVYVLLRPEDTARLSGKFIYQISLIDPLNITEVPEQGIMTIIKNINPNFISQGV